MLTCLLFASLLFACTDDQAVGHHLGLKASRRHPPLEMHRSPWMLALLARADLPVVGDHRPQEASKVHLPSEMCFLEILALSAGADGRVVVDHLDQEAPGLHLPHETQHPQLVPPFVGREALEQRLLLQVYRRRYSEAFAVRELLFLLGLRRTELLLLGLRRTEDLGFHLPVASSAEAAYSSAKLRGSMRKPPLTSLGWTPSEGEGPCNWKPSRRPLAYFLLEGVGPCYQRKLLCELRDHASSRRPYCRFPGSQASSW